MVRVIYERWHAVYMFGEKTLRLENPTMSEHVVGEEVFLLIGPRAYTNSLVIVRRVGQRRRGRITH